jgi:hypothetical protein
MLKLKELGIVVRAADPLWLVRSPAPGFLNLHRVSAVSDYMGTITFYFYAPRGFDRAIFQTRNNVGVALNIPPSVDLYRAVFEETNEVLLIEHTGENWVLHHEVPISIPIGYAPFSHIYHGIELYEFLKHNRATGNADFPADYHKFYLG